MRTTHRLKFVERKKLIELNGEAFIDSKQHIDPHELVYCKHDYLPITKARFKDNKKIARLNIEHTDGFYGSIDVSIEEFNKFPILEVIIEYDEQNTRQPNT